MAARPPTNDVDEEPDVIAFGIAAVDARLDDADDLSFPAGAEDVIRALGDPEIPYDAHGRTVRLSAAIEESDRDRFDSRRELLNTLHPVFERERRTSGGFVDWIRTMLPVKL